MQKLAAYLVMVCASPGAFWIWRRRLRNFCR